ncbi:hypothetical protein LCGC14_0637590 [marine sediment metagenome]|uniref:Uncharacterized protein n=1 Tax=marine sediment metagenome TaxID=412755 RepID=A0A0F9U8J3_9ZZZZ
MAELCSKCGEDVERPYWIGHEGEIICGKCMRHGTLHCYVAEHDELHRQEPLISWEQMREEFYGAL